MGGLPVTAAGLVDDDIKDHRGTEQGGRLPLSTQASKRTVHEAI